MYMNSEDSAKVIEWAGKTFPSGIFINYEQVQLSKTATQGLCTDNKKSHILWFQGSVVIVKMESYWGRLGQNFS